MIWSRTSARSEYSGLILIFNPHSVYALQGLARHRCCTGYGWHKVFQHVGSSTPAPPPRRPWTHLCHRRCSPGIFGFVGRHIAHIVPASARTSNNTSPTTPSRTARHPIHPSPHPSYGPTPTPRLRTPLLGRPGSRQRTSNTTGRRTTAPRTRMATPSSFSITPGFPHRTNCKPRPSQPGHAPITVRPICQQNFHDHPFWIRHHLSLSPLPCPTPPTPTSPIASVSPHLSVPSHSRPTRRPSRSMRPGRGFTGTGDPVGKGSSQSLPGSRGQGNHQHPPQRSQPGPHQPARWQKDRGHSQWPPTMGGSATRGRHHLGIPFDLIQPAQKTCRPIRRSMLLQDARTESKERTYPELLRSRRCRLVVLALETGGRWSPEATTFLRLLAQTKARAVPNILRKAVEASLLSRWSAILTHAAQHAFAASLLDLDCAGTSTPDGDTPSISQLLSEVPLPPPPTSRLPARP